MDAVLEASCVDAPLPLERAHQMPVTVLVGSFASGKTTVLKHLLARSNSRIAIIINEIADISTDLKQLLDSRAKMPAALAMSSEVTGGCICCNRREAFVDQMCSFAASGDIYHLVVEAAGVAEPIHIAENFALVHHVVCLENMVTIVDAACVGRSPDPQDLDHLNEGRACKSHEQTDPGSA